jgi:hypothetical protein
MFGTLVRGVRGEFRAAGGAAGFDFLGFFFGEARNFRGRNFFRLTGFFFAFFFLEFGAADNSICLGFFVLSFDKAGSECGDLIVAQININANRFRFVRRRCPGGLDGCAACDGGFRGRARSFCYACCFGFRACIGQ